MSNFLAIATVTATLSRVLSAAVGSDVPGAAITTLRPDDSTNGAPDTGVNIYLYQVTPNAAWRNADLPTRRDDGRLVQRPQVALNLQYLLSFHGNEVQLEPQRLLGSVVRTLHTRAVLTRQMISDTVGDASNAFLAGSDLAEEVELIKFTPSALSLEELSKLWSVFFQVPYTLSVAYQASVVLIEPEVQTQEALPVRERSVYVGPRSRPVIELLLSRSGPDEPAVADRPILSTDDLIIRGRGLRGGTTRVLVGGIEANLEEVSDMQIVLSLPTRLQAGTQTVQVVHRAPTDTPAAPPWSAESNAKTFELRPHITSVSLADVQGSGDEPRSANIVVRFRPKVGKAQRVTLLLDERFPPDTHPPRHYSFDAPPRTQPTDPETSASLTIPVSGLLPGRYLVRVRVDGAESLLRFNADTGRYNSPRVTIP